MKFNKFKKKTDDNTERIHVCKKCGYELTSTNKDKLCDNCRRQKASNIKKGATIALSLAGTVVLAVLKKGKDKE